MLSYSLATIGFDSQYIIFEDGTILNTETNKFLKIDKHNRVTVKKNGKPYHKSIRVLYKLVFNRYLQRADTIPDLDGEQWKEIEHFKGCYLISSKGRIKTYAKHASARILNPYLKKKDQLYLYTDLCLDGRTKSIAIHRLVAKAFLSDYDESKDIHHKDGNPLNNDISNLQALTPAEHQKLHTEQRQQEKEKKESQD